MKYEEDLENPISKSFIEKSSILEDELGAVIGKDVSNVLGVKVTGFSSGSLIVEFSVVMDDDALLNPNDVSRIVESIVNAAKSGDFVNFNVDPNFLPLVKEDVEEPEHPEQPEEPKEPTGRPTTVIPRDTTAAPQDVGKCKKQQLSAGRFGMLGAYTPQCKDDGSFKEKQCHGSTGYCWCVEVSTGKEIPNTRKGEGRGE
jgi:hypothetical protein